MPVVFVHGVTTRAGAGWPTLETLLRRYIAPMISDTPDQVLLSSVYWYEENANLAWNGASRPLSSSSVLNGARHSDATAMSPAERVQLLSSMDSFDAMFRGNGSHGYHGFGEPSDHGATIRLKDLTPHDLSDLLAASIQMEARKSWKPSLQEAEVAQALIAADEIAHGAGTFAVLTALPHRQAEAAWLREQVSLHLAEIAVVGSPRTEWLAQLDDRIEDSFEHISDAAGYAATQAVAQCRRPLNEAVTRFIGDAFQYVNHRGTTENPGPVAQRLLAALQAARENQQSRGGEPLVVLTHSMGGQLLYDAVTAFLPALGSDIRVDFWAAAASQVGLFEEMKMFLASDPLYSKEAGNRVPFPSPEHLGAWWNVWDPNDFLSFSSRSIFEGVVESPFRSGMSVLEAHTGYLVRPSFFRVFAEKLRSSQAVKTTAPNKRLVMNTREAVVR